MTGFAFAYAVMRACGGQPRKNPGTPAWNTLCLPFSLTAEQIAAHADFAGATLMELDTDGKNGFDPTDGTLWLSFKEATAIAAGVPYIVKWDKAADYDSNPSDYDFTSPMFSGVTIDAAASTTVSDADEGLEPVQMVGCYSPVSVTGELKERANHQTIRPLFTYTTNIGLPILRRYPKYHSSYTLTRHPRRQ